MSKGKTTAHSDAILGVLKNTSAAGQATWYVAIIKAMPSADDMTGATECSYTSYDRASIASTGWSGPSGTTPRTLTNTADINFPQATGADSGLYGIAICKHADDAGYPLTTAGEVVYFGDLSGAPISIASGNQVKIAAGNLTISED